MSRYCVLVDNHAHSMDEDHRYEHGAYDSAEEAVAVCKAIVDAALRELHTPGLTAEALFEMYGMFGEDPFIVSAGGAGVRADFSAWDYARRQSNVITTSSAGIGLPKADAVRCDT